MGRPRKSGKRTANGKRLSRAKAAVAEQFPVSGANGQAQRRQDRFRPFGGPSSIGLEMTCIGRLLLVGAFDGTDAAPDAIYNALQEYGRGYWQYYHGTGHRVSDYAREVRGLDGDGSEIPEDAPGEWFNMADKNLRDAGRDARKAVHSVTVDLHWFPDTDAEWAARIINSRILQKRAELVRAKSPVPDAMMIGGELAEPWDWTELNNLLVGALTLARRGTREKLAA